MSFLPLASFVFGDRNQVNTEYISNSLLGENYFCYFEVFYGRVISTGKGNRFEVLVPEDSHLSKTAILVVVLHIPSHDRKMASYCTQ